MGSALGGAGGGDVDGERSASRGLVRRGGVGVFFGLKSASTRSSSEGGVRLRFAGGAGDDAEVLVVAFAPVSQGSVRGMNVVGCRKELRSGVAISQLEARGAAESSPTNVLSSLYHDALR